MAVTKLFSSFKRSSVHMGDYVSIVHCMKNIPSERQMQVTFIWTWYSFFSGQMSLLESTILLGCCTRGPKSSSFWKKKRGPSVCPGRSTVGTCNHTGFTAWWSGLFNLKWLPFCNLTHCLNFLSGFHFHASFIISFFFLDWWYSFMWIQWREWLTPILYLGHLCEPYAFLLLDNLQMFLM